MKKLILIIMMIASIQSFAGQDGGGGGVIKRDGMYLTFGSAKIKVGTPQGIENVPGLDLLINVLDATKKTVPEEFQGQLVNALLPSDQRRYFRIDQSQLDSNTYARLIAEYKKLLNGQVNPSTLDLAAITIKEDTFLLPPFFYLKPSEQAAILFHESIWLLKPDITYDELVNSEMIMQSHIEKYGVNPTYNPDLALVIGKILDNYALVFFSALQEDINAGLFKKAVTETKEVQVSKRKKELRPVEKQAWMGISELLGNLNEEGLSPEQKGRLVARLRTAMSEHPQYKSIKALYALRNQVSRVSVFGETVADADVRGSCVKFTYTNEICFFKGQ